MKLSKPWWKTDAFLKIPPIPDELRDIAGTDGIALVRAFANGSTSPGWGLEGRNGAPGFMENYHNKEFSLRKVLYGYERDKWAFAFVMRSMSAVVIDIDGKNGGFEHANELLGNSAPTLTEISKSGNGYHLFYSTDEVWDEVTGFGEYADQIGAVQGVDVRAVGCVYHHQNQRWNDRPIAPLPKHLKDKLAHRAQQRAASTSFIGAVVGTEDKEEILLMQEELTAELNKPIPAGKRNNTLFAIGSQMRDAGVQDWGLLVSDRAAQIGLSVEEADKLLDNIDRYRV